MPALFEVETQAGTPILVHGSRLLLFAKSLRLHLPMINFGVIWNRPVSILLIRPDGEEQVIPIRDRTREIVWTFYGAIVVLAALTALIEFRKRGNR